MSPSAARLPAALLAALLLCTPLQGCAVAQGTLQELLPGSETARGRTPGAPDRPSSIDVLNERPAGTEHRFERDPRRAPSFNHPLYHSVATDPGMHFMRELAVVVAPEPWPDPQASSVFIDLHPIRPDLFIQGTYWPTGGALSPLLIQGGWYLAPWWSVASMPVGVLTLPGSPRW